MTQIVNLPALTTITNSLVFPAADTGDSNRTKKVTLEQLVALSAGPRGPAGVPGIPGPSGPSGPPGPGADQSLNTGSSVVFQSVTVTNRNSGIVFGDSTVQTTAYRRAAQELSGFSIGNISLTADQIVASILTGAPPVGGRNLYLPVADNNTAGFDLIIRNRSGIHSFTVWGGFLNLATVGPNSNVRVACDGGNWFLV